MSNIRPTDADSVDGLDADEIGRSDAEIETIAQSVEQVRSDSEIRNAVDGSNVSVGDADSVDGQDASQLGADLSATTPTDKTSNRSEGTQYFNSTGVPIVVYIVTGDTSSGTATFNVDGLTIAEIDSQNSKRTLSAVVPYSATYRFSGVNVGSWHEQELSA